MKKFFTLALALVCATVLRAQGSLIATLSHEGEISVFYGVYALIEAHAAATNGDIITLSEGEFASVDLTKGLTIRGAGMRNTETSGMTVLQNSFNIDIPDEAGKLTLEGIYHNQHIVFVNANNPVFLKCRLNHIYPYDNLSSLHNGQFIHCLIRGSLSLWENSSATCTNSFIWHPSAPRGFFSFQNCIIRSWGETVPSGNASTSNPRFSDLHKSMFANCILCGSNTQQDELPVETVASNCIYIGQWEKGAFAQIANPTNVLAGTIMEDVFKSYWDVWDETEDFELTQQAQEKYLGTDGKQVGLYGGELPFSTTPTGLQVINIDVPDKSTSEGLLNVSIQVK
jgi:hypothetical protein